MGVGCGRQETRDVGELAALLEGDVSGTVAALACVRWLRGPSHVPRFSLWISVTCGVRYDLQCPGSGRPPRPSRGSHAVVLDGEGFTALHRHRPCAGHAPSFPFTLPSLLSVSSTFVAVATAPSRLRGERIGSLTPGPGSRGGSRWPRRPAGRQPSSRSPAAPPLSCLKLCALITLHTSVDPPSVDVKELALGSKQWSRAALSALPSTRGCAGGRLRRKRRGRTEGPGQSLGTEAPRDAGPGTVSAGHHHTRRSCARAGCRSRRTPRARRMPPLRRTPHPQRTPCP